MIHHLFALLLIVALCALVVSLGGPMRRGAFRVPPDDQDPPWYGGKPR